jgi:hypothetical protein
VVVVVVVVVVVLVLVLVVIVVVVVVVSILVTNEDIAVWVEAGDNDEYSSAFDIPSVVSFVPTIIVLEVSSFLWETN